MEEVSVRELVEIILKGKWIIGIVTCIFVAAAIVTSFFIIEPTYEAQTMLMILPISEVDQEKGGESGIKKLVASFNDYPQMTIDTYREQVKTYEVLEYIRKKAGLEDKTLQQIADKITVKNIENTNILVISVRDRDPGKAAEIANLVSQRFEDFVSETNRRKVESSAEFINAQMEKEKEDLDAAMEELKDFLAMPRGVSELRQELSSKLSQLTSYKTQIAQVKINEQTVRESLIRAREIMQSTSQAFVVDKTIVDDKQLADVAAEKTGLKASDIMGIKMSSEEINSVYTAVAKRINSLEIQLSALIEKRANIEKEISTIQKQVEKLQAEFAEKQQRLNMLNHNVSLIKHIYNTYSQEYKEAMIKQSAEIGKSSIVVVSPAIPPSEPVSPKKALNIAIAAVLGIMASVFAVFIKEYWRNTDNSYEKGLKTILANNYS